MCYSYVVQDASKMRKRRPEHEHYRAQPASGGRRCTLEACSPITIRRYKCCVNPFKYLSLKVEILHFLEEATGGEIGTSIKFTPKFFVLV